MPNCVCVELSEKTGIAIDYTCEICNGSGRIPRMWPVYCICEGLQGLYMPTNVNYHPNKRSCLADMAEQKRDLLDSEYNVIGNAVDGYAYGWDEDSMYYCVTWNVEYFPTKKERDQFITENNEY